MDSSNGEGRDTCYREGRNTFKNSCYRAQPHTTSIPPGLFTVLPLTPRPSNAFLPIAMRPLLHCVLHVRSYCPLHVHLCAALFVKGKGSIGDTEGKGGKGRIFAAGKVGELATWKEETLATEKGERLATGKGGTLATGN